MYHACMHPEARERRFPCKMLGLRNSPRVVRERKVSPATMNVYLWAEVMYRHRAALDMPARTTRTPGARPCRFAGSLRLPEHEIERVLLTGIVGIIPALVGDGEHGRIVVQANCASHYTEIWVRLDTVIDVAATFICISTRQQRLNDLDHRRRFLGGMSVNVRAAHIQGVHIA